MTKELTNNGNGRRVRKNFENVPAVIDVPNLIEIQINSYERFLLWDIKPEDRRADEGLESVFRSIFPITDASETAVLEYLGYEIGIW